MGYPVQGKELQAADRLAVALAEAGQCWCELWCGPQDTGRWVHVDPVAGWLDKPAEVQSAAFKQLSAEPLSYVVAFANAGAKDVTQR